MHLNKHLKRLFILLLIFSWLLAAWPPLWQNPRFPPEIQEAQAAPFPNGYSYRRLIDITDAQVSAGPHTNFPILFSTTIADLKTTANGGKVTDAEGDDIIFTASDGTTQLSHEVEKYTATTGELVAWVRIPSLASTTTFYIYYGNSSVTTFQGSVPGSVWNANFKGVWHIHDDFLDSTSNNLDGTNSGSTDVAGKIADGQSFNGTSQYIELGNPAALNFGTGDWTIEFWGKTLASVAMVGYGKGGDNTPGVRHYLGLLDNVPQADLITDDDINKYIVTSGVGNTYNDGLWHHFVGHRQGTTLRLYMDGAFMASATTVAGYDLGLMSQCNAGIGIGRDITASCAPIKFWDGQIDEVRVSATARSAGWVQTEYNNQDSPAGFYAIGAEETNPSFTQSAYRLFNNLNSTDVGTALAAQDTAATLGAAGDAFRLRMLLHISDAQLDASAENFKLQFAEQSGTCDTGFVGETYADVTAATVIAYNDNSTPADGDNLTANANDPTHGADTIVNQDYEELNNFTNSVAAIPAGQDGKWDFALVDNGATADTAYCLRAVKSDATVLDTYTVIPQITTAAGGPTNEQRMWHGKFFSGGAEQPMQK